MAAGFGDFALAFFTVWIVDAALFLLGSVGTDGSRPGVGIVAGVEMLLQWIVVAWSYGKYRNFRRSLVVAYQFTIWEYSIQACCGFCIGNMVVDHMSASWSLLRRAYWVRVERTGLLVLLLLPALTASVDDLTLRSLLSLPECRHFEAKVDTRGSTQRSPGFARGRIVIGAMSRDNRNIVVESLHNGDPRVQPVLDLSFITVHISPFYPPDSMVSMLLIVLLRLLEPVLHGSRRSSLRLTLNLRHLLFVRLQIVLDIGLFW